MIPVTPKVEINKNPIEEQLAHKLDKSAKNDPEIRDLVIIGFEFLNK